LSGSWALLTFDPEAGKEVMTFSVVAIIDIDDR
jgi:hypothetical protein